uniref:Uncharacterized protein n=1 Tax=Salix viminalis TaxID=40686 RepID=A0A6N2MGJ0_SALVM
MSKSFDRCCPALSPTVPMELHPAPSRLIASPNKIPPLTYNRNKDYAVKVSGVKISPNPVKKGKPATFIISATTKDGCFGKMGAGRDVGLDAVQTGV